MTTINSENKERFFLIDITSDVSYPINIGKQWCISTPPSGRNIVGVKKHIEKKVYLQSGTIKIDKSLEVNEKELFSVIYDGSEYPLSSKTPLEIKLNSGKTYFQLFLNPMAITDCTETQSSMSKVYEITLPLSLMNEDKQEIVSKNEIIRIKFAEVHSELKVELCLDDKFKRIKFSPDLYMERIGTLRISNPATLKYFPNLNGRVSFQVKTIDAENADKKQVPAICLDLDAIDASSIDTDGNGFSIKDLIMGQIIEVPICANFEELGNPYEFPDGREYHISAATEYWESDDSPLKEHGDSPSKKHLVSEASMTVTPNQEIIQLGVYVEDWKTGKSIKIENGTTFDIPSEACFVPGSGMGFYNDVVIRNQANVGRPGAGISITDIERKICFFPTGQNSASSVLYSQSKLNDNAAFGVDLWTTCCFLPCSTTSDKESCYKFGFSANSIKEINSSRKGEERYNVTVRLKLNVKYDIHDGLGGKDSHTFSCNIDWPIFQKPYPEWMGIDFGTSAIVGVYGKGTTQVLNLHAMKSELFPRDNDLYEVGTPFLSSNVIFNHGAFAIVKNVPISQLLQDGFEEKPPYKQLAICLSPTSSYEDSNSRYILPCLKLLVGYERVPNVDKYKDFKYFKKNEKNGVEETSLVSRGDDTGTDEYSDLTLVNHVFEEVYSELFHYFIHGSLNRNMLKRLNNVILTYPNTYTAGHLRKMESIVRGGLKDLNLRNVKFVSESDAVACYYQSHKRKLNPNAPKNKESVLVYDMGAGTLDVTLFDVVNEGDITKIDIKGKIGIAKAGNYIDSVIAQVLSKTFKSWEKYVFQDNINADRLDTARRVKQFIKTEVKPTLSLKNRIVELTLSEARQLGISVEDFNNHKPKNNTISLDLESLIQADEDYKKLISDCTTGFFDNFFRFLGYDENNRPCIDTVVLSGRSAKLKDVQIGVEESINDWNGEKKIEVVDLSEHGKGNDLSKTAVVEGALDFAFLQAGEMAHTIINSRNVMAKFGVKYVNLGGEVCYQELLNPFKEKPIKGTIEKNGMKIYTYKTKPVQLTLSDYDKEITLIQTYSANTEDDLRDEKTEYITEIAKYEGASIVHLSIEVNEDNQLILNMNGAETAGVPPSLIDITAPANKMSLWPMLNN